MDTGPGDSEVLMIHKTATIDKKAVIGSDVSIGPYSYIEGGVVIGDGCVIGPHVSIFKHTTIGDGCEVHAGAVLGDTPQDVGFGGDESYVRIGARCIIREGVTVHRGTKPGTITQTGDSCFLMAFSHLAHNVKLGNGVIVANGALLAGYVEVGDRAFISGNVVIHQFTKIGRLVMVGGSAGLSKDVPPFCLVDPLGANVIAGLNIVGLKRAGLSPEERRTIKTVYKLLYRSNLLVKDALEEIKKLNAGFLAEEIVTFVENSSRGICTMIEK